MLPVAAILPHKTIKKETTRSGVLDYSVGDLVIVTLEKLDDYIEIKNQQGGLSPIEENLGFDGEYLPYSNKEQLRGEEKLDYNEYLNGEGEGYLELGGEEEQEEDMVGEQLDWKAQGPLTIREIFITCLNTQKSLLIRR